jgi:hypothetical protein
MAIYVFNEKVGDYSCARSMCIKCVQINVYSSIKVSIYVKICEKVQFEGPPWPIFDLSMRKMCWGILRVVLFETTLRQFPM